jgi:uncharacterized protein DUF6247
MGLAERQSAERWQLTGVDLDTRRRRVLEELALKGRTDEQARFRAELSDAVDAFQQTEDLSRLERVVEAWYRHAVMLRYAPGWADKLDRLRRGERPEAEQRGPFTLDEALEDLGLPDRE